MKQKFYSQVNMDRIFFFGGRAPRRIGAREGGRRALENYRGGSNRGDPRRWSRRAPRNCAGGVLTTLPNLRAEHGPSVHACRLRRNALAGEADGMAPEAPHGAWLPSR